MFLGHQISKGPAKEPRLQRLTKPEAEKGLGREGTRRKRIKVAILGKWP